LKLKYFKNSHVICDYLRQDLSPFSSQRSIKIILRGDATLIKAINDNIQDCDYIKMDVTNSNSIEEGLLKVGSDFDILIDDSTHVFEDQIKFINVAYKHLKPGGMLIIEDIFINANEEDYSKELNHLSDYFSSATFIFANHDLKYSPGWNNDKLLILHRNDKLCL
jgi:SAM-dependent methyltransferase